MIMLVARQFFFLTAKDTLEDKIHAFEVGGDDYLVKPFAMEELHVRLLALSKRGRRTDIGKLTFEDMEMDIKAGTLYRQQKLIKLAPIQLKIIGLLMKKKHLILSVKMKSLNTFGVMNHHQVTP